MKQVSIQELKRHLSATLAEVSRGEEILITRHRQPLARLIPPDRKDLHVGSQYGRGKLKPVLHGNTRGAYLRILADDRRGSSKDK